MGGTAVVAEWPAVENSLLTGLLAYWDFEETSGSIVDEINNYSLSAYNTPTYSVTGKINDSVSFSRASDQRFYNYSALSDMYDTIGTNDVSCSVWLKITGDTNVQRGVVALRGNYYINIYLDTSNKFRVSTNITGTTGYVISNDVMSTDTWYHIVYLFDRDSTLRFYINGVLQTSTFDISSASATSIAWDEEGYTILGNFGTSSSYAFSGVIDELGVYNRLLTTDEIAELYNSGNGVNIFEEPSSFPITSLLSYYKLEEASGTIYDSHGSVNFTTYNSPEYQRTGKIDYGIGFSGAGNPGASCGSSYAGLNPGGDEYSISCWVYLDSLPTTENHDFYILRGALSASPWYNIHIMIANGSNKVALGMNGASDSYFGVTSTNALTTGTWYHIVGIISGIGNPATVYVNGVSNNGAANQVGNIYDATSQYTIGSPYGGSTESFHGIIDELAVYNRALSSEEVSILYNSGTGLAYPF